ncbi:hypothetical protein [Lysinibacillus sp. fls2-241-R2A-57]|uniref:hypothetical protein n=1 Tax=Lysinibacillus sp. fls2-241-R2A-57 TaxID=3040292 RepID=UPI0025532FB0|nr:hypothetical protein [Lysinibacillus sp. fls2-241-R2A-57]
MSQWSAEASLFLYMGVLSVASVHLSVSSMVQSVAMKVDVDIFQKLGDKLK